MKILELFCGYGTASFALKQLGIPYECVGYSDIDKYANQCFRQNHMNQGKNEKGELWLCHPKELGDATKIDPENLEDFDLLTGGFPCQAFSVAGKGLGELDTRGTLFREIIRIAEVKQPRYMLLENVKGLTNKTHKATFEKILSELARIGYFVHWKVLNTKDYGIPQNRERIWFVCFRNFSEYAKFEFPEKEELKIFLKDILEDEVEEKYYLGDKAKRYITNEMRIKKAHTQINGDISLTHTAKGQQNWTGTFIAANRYRTKAGKGECFETRKDGTTNTISTVQKDNYVCEKLTIRKLTPKECFRLQGFLNDEVNLEGLSNTQQYKLAGNGQSVNVVKKIFEKMFQ